MSIGYFNGSLQSLSQLNADWSILTYLLCHAQLKCYWTAHLLEVLFLTVLSFKYIQIQLYKYIYLKMSSFFSVCFFFFFLGLQRLKFIIAIEKIIMIFFLFLKFQLRISLFSCDIFFRFSVLKRWRFLYFSFSVDSQTTVINFDIYIIQQLPCYYTYIYISIHIYKNNDKYDLA